MPKKRNVTWQSFVFLPTPFFAGSIVVAQQLNRLESGEAKRVLLWVPLNFIYRWFGYWPTVLLPSVIGLLCLAAVTVVYVHERRRTGADARSSRESGVVAQ